MEKLRLTLSLHPKPYPRLSRHKISCSDSNPNPDTKPSLLRVIPDWADAIQERGMRKKRSLYTPADWRAHRSSRRHLRHLLSSLSSRVILSLVPPVLIGCGLLAFLESITHKPCECEQSFFKREQRVGTILYFFLFAALNDNRSFSMLI